MDGVVREVSDEEILEHRAMVARWGFGLRAGPVPPASSGLRKLLDEQVISSDETVVCILTGHELKDPCDGEIPHRRRLNEHAGCRPAQRTQGRLSNRPIPVADDLQAIIRALT